jgi:hypothetical protein
MTSESVHKLVEMLVNFWGLSGLHRYVEQGNAGADLQQRGGINGEGKKERNRSNKVKQIANMNPRNKQAEQMRETHAASARPYTPMPKSHRA